MKKEQSISEASNRDVKEGHMSEEMQTKFLEMLYGFYCENMGQRLVSIEICRKEPNNGKDSTIHIEL